MPVITITSRKGGVGKTTTTANLAGVLSAWGKSVLLVDLDPQGNLTDLFGVDLDDEQVLGSAQLLDPGKPLPLSDVVTLGVTGNVDLVASIEGPLTMAEERLSSKVGRERYLADALAGVSAVYDYVLIDTAPNVGLLTQNAIVASDAVIAISGYSLWDAQGATRIQSVVAECARQPGVTARFLGVVFNKVAKGEVITRLVGADMESQDLPLLNAGISRATIIAQAAYAGETIAEFEPESVTAKEYVALMNEIEGLLAPPRIDLAETREPVGGAVVEAN